MLHVIAVTIGWYGYERIGKQQHRLRAELLPLSTASQRIAAAASRLTLLTDAVDDQQNQTVLEDLERQIQTVMVAIHQDLDMQDQAQSDVSDLFEQLESSVLDTLAAQHQTIERDAAFDKEHARVLELVEGIALSLETFDTSPLASARSIEIQSSQRAVASWQVDLLSLPRLSDPAAVEQIRLNLTQSLRTTVRILSQANILVSEEGLSEHFFELLSSATSADGLLDLRLDRIAATRAVQSEVAAVSQLAAELSGQLDELVTHRNSEAAAASVDLQRLLRHSEWILNAVSLLALLLSFLFARYIVFGQIVKPLDRLTRRTAALAAGDITTPIPKQKFKELVAIADSLTVFRRKLEQLADTEEELRQQNDRLNTANTELNRFAYAASHDLRSPLRGAQSLAGFIREDLQGQVSDTVDQHLTRLNTRLQKMEVLLEDLLAYSRAGSDLESRILIELQPLVADALEVVTDTQQVELRFDLDETTAWLPPIAIKQCVRNLLDNSVKHAGACSTAGLALTFRSYRADSQLVLEVEDNGPGIPAAYRHKMLELFQTLETHVAKQSSGIGLAMVQRLLLRYDGSLTLHAATEHPGTLARITLPWVEP